LLGQINSLLDFTVGKGSERDSLQKEMIKMLVDATLPGLQEAMGRANEGLSPEARAAMETRAIEDPARLAEPERQRMMTDLLRSGALGTQIPGSPGDITRAFGDLAAKREALRSQGLTQIAIQDEEQRTVNRAQALEAAQIQASLLGTAGALLDPAAFLNTTANILGISQNVLATFTQSQNDALRIVGDLLRTRADLDPESLKNIVISGLLSKADGIVDVVLGLFKGEDGTKSALRSLWDWITGREDGSDDDGNGGDRNGGDGPADGTDGSLEGIAKDANIDSAGIARKIRDFISDPRVQLAAAATGTALTVNWLVGRGRDLEDTWVYDIQNPFGTELGRINTGVDLNGTGEARAEDALRQLDILAQFWDQGASALARKFGSRATGVVQGGVGTVQSIWRITYQEYLRQAGRPNDPIPLLRSA
jgi:hypothetical protein